MITPPWKAEGAYFGEGPNGERVCRGARLGRYNSDPRGYDGQKLHLRRVPICSQGYDPGGAYWGHSGTGNHVYAAWNNSGAWWCWAKGRPPAKLTIRVSLANPHAPKFYDGD